MPYKMFRPAARGRCLPFFALVLLMFVLSLSACAPKRIVSVEPEAIESGDTLFLKTEDLFAQGMYAEALSGFQAYLRRFPSGPLADAALMKIATIYGLLNESDKALETYQYLLATYPDSPFVTDATLEMMTAFYVQNRFESVIAQAAEIPEEAMTPRQKLRVRDLLGSSYLNIGDVIEAAYQYLRAYDLSLDEDRKIVRAKLEKVITRMSQEDMAGLIKRLAADKHTGWLLFHLGTVQAEDGDYAAALLSLTTFVDNFPEHPYAEQARVLIDEVNREAISKPYKIGCLLPLSGPYEIYGYRALKGIELALNQLFTTDPAPPFQLIVKDSASDSKSALKAVTEMAQQGVAVIIGPIITAEVAAIEAEIQGVPIITLTQKGDITAIGDYVFRNFITPAMQVEAIVSYATDALEVERFAILYPDENYGQTFMHLFWDQVIEARGKVVGVEMYEPNQTDFVEPIKKLVGLYYKIPDELKTDLELTIDDASQRTIPNRPIVDLDAVYSPLGRHVAGLYASIPASLKRRKGILFDEAYADEVEPQPTVDFDALFIPDAPQKAGLIIPQLAFYDVEGIYLLGTNLWHSRTLLEMSREYVQGAIMPDGFFAQSRRARVQSFVEGFEKIYGETPGLIEATTYDTASLLFDILRRREIRFRSALRDALMQVENYPGVTGTTAFNDQGEAVKEPFLLRVKGDRFVELETR